MSTASNSEARTDYSSDVHSATVDDRLPSASHQSSPATSARAEVTLQGEPNSLPAAGLNENTPAKPVPEAGLHPSVTYDEVCAFLSTRKKDRRGEVLCFLV